MLLRDNFNPCAVHCRAATSVGSREALDFCSSHGERERKDAMITWKQISIFIPSQIKSSRDVKGMFLGISFVSSQVSMQLVGELLRKEGSSVMAVGWACMG